MSEGLRRRHRRYLNIPSETIEDGEITLKALGLLNVILNKPEGWVVRADAIARARTKDGREAVSTGLKELSERGYYRVERRRLLDGTFKMGNAVSEEPVASWRRDYEAYEGKPVPLIQQKDGSFRVRLPDGTLAEDGFENQVNPQVAPVTGFPEPVNPVTGEAGTGDAVTVAITEELLNNKPHSPSVSESRAYPHTREGAHAREENSQPALIPASTPEPDKTSQNGSKTQGVASERAFRMTLDWRPSEEMLERARHEAPGVDLDFWTRDFVEFWSEKQGNGSSKKTPGWHRAWMTSMKSRKPTLLVGPAAGSPEQQAKADEVVAWWATQGIVPSLKRAQLRTLVLDALVSGATARQVAEALRLCAEPCPADWKFGQKLWQVAAPAAEGEVEAGTLQGSVVRPGTGLAVINGGLVGAPGPQKRSITEERAIKGLILAERYRQQEALEEAEEARRSGGAM